MVPAAFDRFYALVLQDARLQEELRETADRAAFVEQVVASGAAHGYRFSAADVTVAMQVQRRTWNARWLR